MILIITEETDITTKEVIDWLLFFKTPFKIQNAKVKNTLNSFIINNDAVSITINNQNLDGVNKVWQRRGNYDFFKSSIKQTNNSSIDFKSLNNYLFKEEQVIGKSIENYSKYINKGYVGSYNKEINNNKLEVLIAAKKQGLSIPETLVTTSKVELLKFYNQHKTIITKDLKSPVNFTLNNYQHTSIGTFVVSKSMIEECEANFFPVFVQKKVEKKYEIRIFCYGEKMFPMAIFSQKDKKTAVDYRNYNNEKPNRCVPINIPKDIESKLLSLQSDLNLNTCSIDIIVSEQDEYVFLEVNPMGQLDWVSKNCNYYIEKYIAEDLAKV